jgi:hypothetical protein
MRTDINADGSRTPSGGGSGGGNGGGSGSGGDGSGGGPSGGNGGGDGGGGSGSGSSSDSGGGATVTPGGVSPLGARTSSTKAARTRLKADLKRCKRQRTRKARATCAKKARKRYAKAVKPTKANINGPSASTGGLGEVMAVTEEDYDRPTCQGQGSFQTWQISNEHNSDGSTKLKLLDLWTTELNELAEQKGRSPATVQCSAHWFDYDNGLIAQGWYDQGVRFLDISNPRDIKQVGYWATTGEFWAAYFAPTDPKREIVYGLDTAGGIDVLKIDRSASASRVAMDVSEADLSRPAAADASTPTRALGFACPLLSPTIVARSRAAL